MAARRRALLDCVHHARTFHKHAWAQTAIELTAEHCWQNKQPSGSQQSSFGSTACRGAGSHQACSGTLLQNKCVQLRGAESVCCVKYLEVAPTSVLCKHACGDRQPLSSQQSTAVLPKAGLSKKLVGYIGALPAEQVHAVLGNERAPKLVAESSRHAFKLQVSFVIILVSSRLKPSAYSQSSCPSLALLGRYSVWWLGSKLLQVALLYPVA
eukprot:1149633-Pelagomonas_calceolata.AAC.2